LNKEYEPLSGTARKGVSLNIGYYDQMHLILDDSLSVMETIWQLVPLETRGYVLSFLARYGFRGDDVDKRVENLSGGEKSRLYLAKLIHQKPNLLILDEPTNHLDIEMIGSLEKALLDYDGTIVFVSHDTYFIEKIAKRKWFFRNNTIEETEQSLQELFAEKEETSKLDKSRKIKTTEQNINPIILKKKYNQIEQKSAEIYHQNELIAILESEFQKPETFKNDQKIKNLNREIKDRKDIISELEKELDLLEHEYLELSV
jgi:ATP-binding cassette subfamily F protein 3